MVSSLPNCSYPQRPLNTYLKVFGTFILALGTTEHALRPCRGDKLPRYTFRAMYIDITIICLNKLTEILSCRPSLRPTISGGASPPYCLPPSRATLEYSVTGCTVYLRVSEMCRLSTDADIALL